MADFNADGKLDLALADSGGASLVVRLGNGDGTLDLAVSSIENNNVAIFLGSGDGTFQDQELAHEPGPRGSV